MNIKNIEELADKYAMEFIHIHTKFVTDGIEHNALCHMFMNFYEEASEIRKTRPLQFLIRKERNHPLV